MIRSGISALSLFEKNVSRPSGLVIDDAIDAQTSHRYAVHFHAAPGCEFVVDENRQARLMHSSGKTLQLVWHWQAGALRDEPVWEITSGWGFELLRTT